MKVLIVSQAGKAADVTFQASCHSEDDSVLKVNTLNENNNVLIKISKNISGIVILQFRLCGR